MSCTYTGDIQIVKDDNDDLGIEYQNGQPCMTDGMDTAVYLSVFSDPTTWQNGLTVNPDEQYLSEFPATIDRATVSDTTIKNGISAIKRALDWMIVDGVCESIDVTGDAVSVYAIAWTIEIIRGNISTRYTINWERGIVAIQKEQEAS